jgi:hypothetical protein
MKKILPGLFFLVCISCSHSNYGEKNQQYFADLLKDVDQLKLIFFNKGDTLSQVITNPQQIEAYKELINGKVDTKLKLKCDSTGKIEYYSKGKLLLDAFFSTPMTGSRFDKACITYTLKPDVYSTQFSYRAGMDVDDNYYKLRSSANRMAADL